MPDSFFDKIYQTLYSAPSEIASNLWTDEELDRYSASPLIQLFKVKRLGAASDRNHLDWQRLLMEWPEEHLLHEAWSGLQQQPIATKLDVSVLSEDISEEEHQSDSTPVFFLWELPTAAQDVNETWTEEVKHQDKQEIEEYLFFVGFEPFVDTGEYVAKESNDYMQHSEVDYLGAQSTISVEKDLHFDVNDLPHLGFLYDGELKVVQGEESVHFSIESVEQVEDKKPLMKSEEKEMEAKSSSDKTTLGAFVKWLHQLPGANKHTYEAPADEKTKEKKRKKKDKTKSTDQTEDSKVKVKGFKKKKKKKTKKGGIEWIIQSSIEEKDDLVSETYAELLAKQEYFDRAIEMYKKLMLIIPEKSSYFASRITELKKKS